jgi:hypothetical protein
LELIMSYKKKRKKVLIKVSITCSITDRK